MRCDPMPARCMQEDAHRRQAEGTGVSAPRGYAREEDMPTTSRARPQQGRRPPCLFTKEIDHRASTPPPTLEMPRAGSVLVAARSSRISSDFGLFESWTLRLFDLNPSPFISAACAYSPASTRPRPSATRSVLPLASVRLQADRSARQLVDEHLAAADILGLEEFARGGDRFIGPFGNVFERCDDVRGVRLDVV